MQSESTIKNSIRNFYSNFGTKKLDHIISPVLFYELKIPPILLEKSEETIDTLNRPIQ